MVRPADGAKFGTSFTYDADGVRTGKKTDLGNSCTYLTLNGKVAREVNTTAKRLRRTLDFVYDESGRPFALNYKLNAMAVKTYYYVLNLQGDVVKLVSADGTEAASYEYDAWGNVLSATGPMADINPLRYRGYYYDVETGFYYLQSRYYDPANHRFINADVYSSTDSSDAVSCNMFAYCGNNPTSRSDETGDFWNFIVGAVVGAVVSAVSTAVDAVKEGGLDALSDGKTWAKIGVSAATGAINGAVAASGLGMFAQAGISAATSAVGDIANQWIDTGSLKEVSIQSTVLKGGEAFCVSVLGSVGGELIGRHVTKTRKIADQYFDEYLDKTFTANARISAGRSSSTLERQASKLLKKVKYYDNLTKGVTSVFGSLLSFRF